MDTLPTEVLQMIFNCLTLSERIRHVRPVCKYWAAIVDSSKDWNSYRYHISSNHDPVLASWMIENMPSLQRLYIGKSYPIVERALKDNTPKLEELLDFSDGSSIGTSYVVYHCRNTLKRLAVSVDIFHKWCYASAISNCNNLEELDVTNLHTYHECNSSLVAVSKHCTSLKNFKFCRNIFSNDSLLYFLEKKGALLSALEIVILADEELLYNLHVDSSFEWQRPEYKNFAWLEKSLMNGYLKNLKELRISGNSRSEINLGRMIFENCPSLTVLELPKFFKLTDKELESICLCSRLSKLFIKYDQISGVGLSYISLCTNLETLALATRQMDLIGETSLLKLKNLKTLQIPHALFSDSFINQLPRKLIHLKTLRISPKLDHHTSFLSSKMPNTTVKFFGSVVCEESWSDVDEYSFLYEI